MQNAKSFGQLQWRIDSTRRAFYRALHALQQLEAKGTDQTDTGFRRTLPETSCQPGLSPLAPLPASPLAGPPSLPHSPQTASPQIGFVPSTPAPAPPQPADASPSPAPHRPQPVSAGTPDGSGTRVLIG
jgi:hypothetical protein